MTQEEIIDKVREWLGEEGISFFRDIQSQYGTVNAVWPVDSPLGPIPHSVHFREGMQVRNFLRGIVKWSAHEYDNNWSSIVEQAIK